MMMKITNWTNSGNKSFSSGGEKIRGLSIAGFIWVKSVIRICHYLSGIKTGQYSLRLKALSRFV